MGVRASCPQVTFNDNRTGAAKIPTMRKLCVILLLMIAAVSVVAQAQEKSGIVRLDSALDDVLSPGAKLEKLAGNFKHLEGPVWVRKGGFLLLSDLDSKVIHKWDPKDGKVSIYPAGIPEPESNGITVDRQGRIVYCARGEGQVVRLENDGRRTVLVRQFEGKALNRPNDLVYKSDGSLYFTDPTDGSDEAAVNHVFRLKGGKLQLLSAKNVVHPNGLAFTPDEKHLYIVDSRDTKTLFRFDVQPDGSIANGRAFIDMRSEKAQGGPDGMKVDQKGNVYAPGPSGLWIISPEGKHLGTVPTPEIFANLAFGDADGKSLYLAGHTTIYRIRVKVPGIRP